MKDKYALIKVLPDLLKADIVINNNKYSKEEIKKRLELIGRIEYLIENQIKDLERLKDSV